MRIGLLLAGGLAVAAWGAHAEGGGPGSAVVPAAVTEEPAADAEAVATERKLQSLNWEQFKSVVAAIPRLKADIDAYGPLGWEYVRNNYQHYEWRKNVSRLDAGQRKQLSDLIRRASK